MIIIEYSWICETNNNTEDHEQAVGVIIKNLL